MRLVPLLALLVSTAGAVHFRIAFKRYSDSHCKVEMHGENSDITTN